MYKCSNPKGEHLTTIRKDADAFVLKALTSYEGFGSHRVLPDAARHPGQDSLMEQTTALDIREETITAEFSKDNIRLETWSAAMASIREQRDELASHLAQAEGDARDQHALTRARVENFMALPLSQKRGVLRAISEIPLHPQGGKRNVPIAEQVTVWAKDERRQSPLVAGTHPESSRRVDSILEARQDDWAASLGPDRQEEG